MSVRILFEAEFKLFFCNYNLLKNGGIDWERNAACLVLERAAIGSADSSLPLSLCNWPFLICLLIFCGCICMCDLKHLFCC